MVKYQAQLDRTFAALSDPTRRAILARLGEQESVSVSELARPFAVSLPAVMKHLNVLSDAGLVTRAKTGRTVACRLNAAPMEGAVEWLTRYARFWSAQLDRLEAFLEEELMDTAVKPSLTLKRRLKAPPAQVFNAWIDPQRIARWFGPGAFEPIRIEADLRVGGRYNFVMRGTDGEEHDVRGVYREIVRDEKLVFTWAWKSTPERHSLVSVTIKPDGDGSLLTLLHEHFYDEAARDRHQFGWNGSLDKLEKLFA